jgi:nicotinamide-nucleotide amidase
MQADIITIGDELLIGQTVNTNTAWIGQQLSLMGMPIGRTVTISDDREEILAAVEESLNRSNLVIVTGGLGPTKDDITKETLCEYFNTELVLYPDVLERITRYFEARGRSMLESNVQQAYLPKDCVVLDNHLGTASGMWFERGGRVVVSIPGVPYEMKALMENEILPRVKSVFSVSGMYHQTVMTQGIGESFLAELIKDWENRIYADGMGLAYLPSPGVVKLRITSKLGVQDSVRIEQYMSEIEKRLPKHVYGRNGESIVEVVAKLLRQSGKSFGTVESCTGGAIASAFVEVPNTSDFFNGSLITYSNEMKTQLCGVDKELLIKYGAVSEEVVKQMATGGAEHLGLDYCIAVSGIAGPDGGTDEKPVGMVWCAIKTPEKVVTRKFQFGTDRGRNIEMTVLSSVNLLRRAMLGQVDESDS